MFQTESSPEPTREEVDQFSGPVVLEFGASWCPHCQAIQPQLEKLLEQNEIKHVKVEDGKGKPLGRSFRVKLWPTLVFMRDGQVLSQVSRPSDTEIRLGLEQLIA
jgi:thioredoxin 1